MITKEKMKNRIVKTRTLPAKMVQMQVVMDPLTVAAVPVEMVAAVPVEMVPARVVMAHGLGAMVPVQVEEVLEGIHSLLINFKLSKRV